MTFQKDIAPLWTVVANIIEERPYGPEGNETRIGTKHFSPGTKVYTIDWFPGMCEDIVVVGLARKPRRFIKVVIRATWVENLRIKLCYDPQALEKIQDHFANDDISRLDKEFAQELYRVIPIWQEEMKKKRK
jgi:hypothetical protein